MALKKTIKFSQNWNNKLSNNIFTTIRKPGFWVNDGDFCVIVLNDKLYCYAKCIDKRTQKLANIDPLIIQTDIGDELDVCRKVLSKLDLDYNDLEQYVDILLLKRMPEPSALNVELSKALKLDL